MLINQIYIDGKNEIVNHVPSISWNLKGTETDIYQKSYKLELFKDSELVYSSGLIESDNCIGIDLPVELRPFGAYKILLTVIDTKGNEASGQAYFKTGRMQLPWNAKWIGKKANEVKTASVKKQEYYEK